MMNESWHKRILNILRWPSLAIGVATTSIGGANASVSDDVEGWKGAGADVEPVILPNTLNATATDRYAAHRSHSSHRSHRSSSGGGGYSRPTPAPSPRVTPTPAPPPTVTTPAPNVRPGTSSSVPKATPKDLSMMTVRVQAALMRLGYYKGDIDGVLGPQTRVAITEYQKAQGLRQTGRMDIGTLSKLGISIP
jgi:His-Xaa-Ser repeat protein HxsA